jgi:hypothetical protein
VVVPEERGQYLYLVLVHEAREIIMILVRRELSRDAQWGGESVANEDIEEHVQMQ